jgi:hypothetical protein
MMPVMTALWLLFIWANHEDYKKKHNIKGWSDKDMNVKQLIVATLVSTVVGLSGFMVGTYYGSIEVVEVLYDNVGIELDILEGKLKDTNLRTIKTELDNVRTQVLSKIPTKASLGINQMSEEVASLNERLLMLSKELMEVHMELEMELSKLEDGTRELVNDMTVTMNTEVKKQFDEMYDKVDKLQADLLGIRNILNTAKETFLGKMIIK